MSPRGISLHIGLNEVDPTEYVLHWHKTSDALVQCDTGDPKKPLNPANLRRVDVPDVQWFMVGFVGRLASCEADAADMAAIAESQKFEATLLKGKAATAKRVVKEIKAAASKLKSGDVFLLTYAGHGSQVPDRSGDEEDEYDETWCLYDRMLIDDERYALLAEFAEGVRIVVVVDCCHSGSTMRDGELDAASARNAAQVRGMRMMSRDAADAVYKGKQEMYNKIQDALPQEPPEVKARLILISACQDDELAGDGEKNGAFTGALKKVWAHGKFSGTYRDFHAKVMAELQSDYAKEVSRAGGDESAANKQTPVLSTVPEDADKDSALGAFVAQKPFSI